MLRSMYSGISGMKVNQTKLDVIGNNIANLGTTGFKASTVKFQDMLSQNMADATAPTASQGGVNSQQVGLGVQLASIDTVMTQGMLQPTGRNLDLALDGGGFFMVSKGPEVFENDDLQVSHKPGSHTLSSNDSGSEMMYTRAGTFILDQAGNLLTSDGYRVMGYPVTNDDNAVAPTGNSPEAVKLRELDIRFGPGSQLNGYKVELGAVGPGTVTDAIVDKESKVIKISGDFSKGSTIEVDAIENAANKALSTAGISQRMNVFGKIPEFNNLGSDRVEGGSDATSPNSVSLMGMTFTFTEGSDFNGYTFKIGDIQADKASADFDEDQKVVTINANFLDASAIDKNMILDAVNAALPKSFNQTVEVIGNPAQIPGIKSEVDGGENGKQPSNVVDDNDKVLIGFDKDILSENMGALNGYKFVVSKGDKFETDINRNEKTITIDYKNAADNQAQVIEDLKKWFPDVAVNEINLDGFGGKTYSVKEGANKTAPEQIEVGGFSIKFPKGEELNGINFEIVDIEGSVDDTEIISKNGKIETIRISGNFLDSGMLDSDTLENKINDLLKTELNNPNFEGVTISGRAKIDMDSESEMIDGGAEFRSPENQSVFGFDFAFDEGAALNGYKVVMGDISQNTAIDAKISETDKTIVLSGDFTNVGNNAARSVTNVINKALEAKGINQGVTVSGEPQNMGVTDTEDIIGGTPVQSLTEDGIINFVDGTQNVKAYDEGLKTLKIPDTVRMPGSDVELRVKSFNIDQQGVINCILEDGSVAAVGQLAIANFKNPEGLSKMGGNLYSQSANSGDATIRSGVGTTGEDNSKGYASTIQGMVEMSNVDLAEQFTDMITTTRAFQASGKIINTGDEILQDIINLKR